MAKKKAALNVEPSKDELSIKKSKTDEAHVQADKDIDQDPDLAFNTRPEDEMDEGELARREGED